MARKIDHEWIRQLVVEIDENGTRLNRDEIDFIATLIDTKAVEFTPEQAKRIERLHDRKVVNGKPDRD
jgi:hypothetical protein